MEVSSFDVVIAFVTVISFVVLCKLVERLLRTPVIPGLNRRYVLVTGCDSGFGNLLTRRLDRRGVPVFAACLTSRGMEELKSKTSEGVVTLQLDVTSHESIVAALEFVRSKLPKDQGLWGLVNNAAIALPRGPLEWCTREDYERVLQVNLLGLIDVTIAFLPLLKRGRGRVVNIASALSRVACHTGGYAESKYGVQAFSDILRRESKALGYGVGVSIVEPGYFNTPMTDRQAIGASVRASWERLSPEKQAEYPPDLCAKCIEALLDAVNAVASSNLSKVPTAVEHALTARWPKTRYSCGMDCRFLFLPLSYAPTWFTDWALCVLMPAFIRLMK